jgi:anti-sigma B factor antagonist
VARLDIGHVKIDNGSKDLVSPKGKLDVFSYGDLKAFFEALRKENRSSRIVVDMSGADYVASSGWSVLLGWRRLMRLGGGSLVLSGMKPEVQRVYESMKIGKLLPSLVDNDAAVQHLNEEPITSLDDPDV